MSDEKDAFVNHKNEEKKAQKAIKKADKEIKKNTPFMNKSAKKLFKKSYF